MGNRAFEKYLNSIRVLIGNHFFMVEYLEDSIQDLKTMVQNGTNVHRSQIQLDKTMAELVKLHTKINDIRKFFFDMKERWNEPQDRVIGFVCWAPSIGVGVAPHHYTRDLCVIELYKDRFKHMIGNVLSLGTILFYLH
jgi:hypothetical protein